MRILLLGDVCGRPGRRILRERLPQIQKDYGPDVVIANGENAAGGFGLTAKVADELFALGVHAITGGNHLWDQKEMLTYITKEPRILRPANYPPGTPGNSMYFAPVNGHEVAVMSLIGRVFMGDFDCPFRRFDGLYQKASERTPYIVVDFHGEATSEKQAFGWYADGRATVVAGTHTHVPTSDQRVLPSGTAFTTDLGMCGPRDGILGVEREAIIKKFRSQLPVRFTVAKGPMQLCGILVSADDAGRAESVERLYFEDLEE